MRLWQLDQSPPSMRMTLILLSMEIMYGSNNRNEQLENNRQEIRPEDFTRSKRSRRHERHKYSRKNNRRPSLRRITRLERNSRLQQMRRFYIPKISNHTAIRRSRNLPCKYMAHKSSAVTQTNPLVPFLILFFHLSFPLPRLPGFLIMASATISSIVHLETYRPSKTQTWPVKALRRAIPTSPTSAGIGPAISTARGIYVVPSFIHGPMRRGIIARGGNAGALEIGAEEVE